MNSDQKQAVRIADRVYQLLKLKIGEREKEVAFRIKQLLKEFGARPAFRIIVASGKRSAKPHGFATTKRLCPGETVMLDFGAMVNGYRSDLTRTIFLGPLTSKQRKIYKVVRVAQTKAIAAVRAGQPCCEIDRAARHYIAQQGYGRYFIHSTGHGIGRKVHQAPKISKKNRRRLKVGDVITIEPGIYLKGWGGVRIEDMVLVTKNGCRVLTRSPRKIFTISTIK